MQTETPLRRARKARGMTQEDLARAVGVTQTHISCIETMAERASPDLAARLVAVLGRQLISEEQILYPERFAKKAA